MPFFVLIAIMVLYIILNMIFEILMSLETIPMGFLSLVVCVGTFIYFIHAPANTTNPTPERPRWSILYGYGERPNNELH